MEKTHIEIFKEDKLLLMKQAKSRNLSMIKYFKSMVEYFETTGINPQEFKLPDSILIKKNRDVFVSFFRENEKKYEKNFKEIKEQLDEILMAFTPGESFNKELSLEQNQSSDKDIIKENDVKYSFSRDKIEQFLSEFTDHPLLPKKNISVKNYNKWSPLVAEEVLNKNSNYSFAFSYYFKEIKPSESNQDLYEISRDQFDNFKKALMQ